jgi:phage repressor protein C with HTH and peptisase S24 domain
LETKEQVRRLRKGLGLTQRKLAEKLGLTVTTIAAWEQGAFAPDGLNCLKLARLADGELARFFYSKAGLKPEDRETKEASPRFNIVTTGNWKEKLQEHGHYIVEVPVVAGHAAAGPPGDIQDDDIDAFLTIPLKNAPRGPGAYTAVRVRGDSMEPLLQDRDFVCVEHGRVDIPTMRGKLVAAVVDGGVVIKRLDRKSTAQNIILLSENKNYGPLTFTPSPSSHLIGPVVWLWRRLR